MQTLRLIGNILAAVLIACCITSCDDDDEKIGGGSQSEKLIKQIAVNDYTYDFTYEGKKLKTIKRGPFHQLGENYIFKYKGNTITIVNDLITLTAKVNKDGYFNSLDCKQTSYQYGETHETTEYIYDSNGQLTMLAEITGRWIYNDYFERREEEKHINSGGNRISSNYYTAYDYEGIYFSGYRYKYIYSDIENKSAIFMDANHLDIKATTGGFYGKASKNLVSKIEITNNYDGEVIVTDFTYEFDDDGYVTKMAIRSTSNGWSYHDISCIYLFSYY